MKEVAGSNNRFEVKAKLLAAAVAAYMLALGTFALWPEPELDVSPINCRPLVTK